MGEKETQLGMWMKLDSNTYKRFHNIIIQTKNGTTQIDHIILSRYGIFVIETKNYNGWIFGGKDQRFWTQVLFGTKNRFQNPLHQNYKHTRALADYLKIDHCKIYSIVFFVCDNVELKGDFPLNVVTSGLSSYIKKFNEFLFPDIEIIRLEQYLKQLETNNTLSTRQHVQILKERYSSDTICPRCGGELVRRIAKTGPRAGSEFLGCSKFPDCRYIKK